MKLHGAATEIFQKHHEMPLENMGFTCHWQLTGAQRHSHRRKAPLTAQPSLIYLMHVPHTNVNKNYGFWGIFDHCDTTRKPFVVGALVPFDSPIIPQCRDPADPPTLELFARIASDHLKV
eukprot:3211535-Amphidinium_carterae.1